MGFIYKKARGSFSSVPLFYKNFVYVKASVKKNAHGALKSSVFYQPCAPLSMNKNVKSAQPQHVLHVVQTRRAPLQPKGCAHGALGESHAAGGLMRNFHTLPLPGE